MLSCVKTWPKGLLLDDPMTIRLGVIVPGLVPEALIKFAGSALVFAGDDFDLDFAGDVTA